MVEISASVVARRAALTLLLRELAGSNIAQDPDALRSAAVRPLGAVQFPASDRQPALLTAGSQANFVIAVPLGGRHQRLKIDMADGGKVAQSTGPAAGASPAAGALPD